MESLYLLAASYKTEESRFVLFMRCSAATAQQGAAAVGSGACVMAIYADARPPATGPATAKRSLWLHLEMNPTGCRQLSFTFPPNAKWINVDDELAEANLAKCIGYTKEGISIAEFCTLQSAARSPLRSSNSEQQQLRDTDNTSKPKYVNDNHSGITVYALSLSRCMCGSEKRDGEKFRCHDWWWSRVALLGYVCVLSQLPPPPYMLAGSEL